MLHPKTRVCRIDDIVGMGVVASVAIPAGTFVWVHDVLDQCIDRARWPRMVPPYGQIFDHCTYLDSLGHRHLPWDGAQFVNHSCAPNCHGTLFGFDIALHDIAAGDMLTNDYGSFGGVDIDFDCSCGAPLCRHTCGAPLSDTALLALAQAFDRALSAADQVPQPLRSLIDDACIQTARRETNTVLKRVSPASPLDRSCQYGEAGLI